jgi:hypothetical protein
MSNLSYSIFEYLLGLSFRLCSFSFFSSCRSFSTRSSFKGTEEGPSTEKRREKEREKEEEKRKRMKSREGEEEEEEEEEEVG